MVKAAGANDDRAVAADAGCVVVEIVSLARQPVQRGEAGGGMGAGSRRQNPKRADDRSHCPVPVTEMETGQQEQVTTGAPNGSPAFGKDLEYS